MSRKKRAQKNNKQDEKYRLKELHITLHNIAFDANLIPLHQRHLFGQRDKRIKQSSSHINVSKSLSSSAQLKEDTPKSSNVKSNKFTKKNPFRNVIKKENENKCKTVESKLNNNVTPKASILQNHEILQAKFRVFRRKILDSDNVSLSNKKNDGIFKVKQLVNNTTREVLQLMKVDNNKNPTILSKSTCCDDTSEMTNINELCDKDSTNSSSVKKKHILNSPQDPLDSNNSNKINILNIINGARVRLVKMNFDDINCSGKKNLPFINYNGKTKEISSESNTSKQCNSDLHPSNVTNRIADKINQKRCKKKQNVRQCIIKKVESSNVTDIDVENKISVSETSENVKADTRSENSYSSESFLTTSNVEINKEQENEDVKMKSSNNIAFLDTQEVPCKYSTYIQCNNDLYSPNVTKETSRKVKQKWYKKSQDLDVTVQVEKIKIDTKKDFITNKITNSQITNSPNHQSPTKSVVNHIQDVSESLSTALKSTSPIMSSHVTEIIPNLSKTSNKNKIKTEGNILPKITQDNILPKGTIKIAVKANKQILQSNVSEKDLLKQNRYNIKDKNTKQTDNIFKSPSLKKNFISHKIDKIISILKIPECTVTLCKNITCKCKDTPDNGLCNKVLTCRNLDSLTELRDDIHSNDSNADTEIVETNGNCDLNRQVESTRLNNDTQVSKNVSKDDIHSQTTCANSVMNDDVPIAAQIQNKNNISQDNEKYKEATSCNEYMLNENITGLMNTDASSDINGSLMSIGEKEELAQQYRKRPMEENSQDLNTNNKRIRLNKNSCLYNNATSINSWLHNNTISIESKDEQQSNDSSSTDATVIAELNVATKDKELDLREYINNIRSKKINKLEAISGDNHTVNAVSMQINLNSINDIVTATNTVESKETSSLKETPILNGTWNEEEDNVQVNSACSNDLYSFSNLSGILEKKYKKDTNQIDINIHENAIQEEFRNDATDTRDSDDDDCISLFTNESFDISQCEETLVEKKKPCKQPLPDVPYVMSVGSFNKYITQNTNEFNEEYAKCIENRVEKLNKPEKAKGVLNKQQERTLHIDFTPIDRIEMKSTPSIAENIETTLLIDLSNLRNYFYGYCFPLLKYRTCYKQQCPYKHILQPLIQLIYSEDPDIIYNIIKYAIIVKYNFFCQEIYMASLTKLSVDQILTIYKMLYNARNSKLEIIRRIIKELLKREISLKTIVNHLMTFIVPTKNPLEFRNIIICLETFTKSNEFWDIVKDVILLLQPDKYIVEKILRDCVSSETLHNIQDINDILIKKLEPIVISKVDKYLMTCFTNLLTEKSMKNSCPVKDFRPMKDSYPVKDFRPVKDSYSEKKSSPAKDSCAVKESCPSKDSRPAILVQDFGESSAAVETIASPDSRSLSQVESPTRYDITFTNTNNADEEVDTEIDLNNKSYGMKLIDDLPLARSIYRDHEQLWKFYMDLERFEKGLKHEDYNYVINILESYAGKQDESSLFVRSCCSILRTEVRRSEYHLANIIRRTVQTGTSGVLGKILLDIGLEILTSLVDEEAWGLALQFIETLNIYDLPCDAKFIMLLAETYLANKKIIKAFELLKYKRIIYTSRTEWHVKSTISDEYVRNKIIYILLDLLCNKFIEHAFFLFQFLLKDQTSQYYPIDLSRYVNKMIMTLLSKDDTSLITEIGGLILKYNITLCTTTCRALTSTLIHMDKILAKQLYNYAEALNIYPTIKFWPVTYAIINTDITEEEIYLLFLRMLERLIMNFGHTIEFIKPHQITVHIIFEIKSKYSQFLCTERQKYDNYQAIINSKALVKNVLKEQFDPPIILTDRKGRTNRVCRLQNKSLVNYLQSQHL